MHPPRDDDRLLDSRPLAICFVPPLCSSYLDKYYIYYIICFYLKWGGRGNSNSTRPTRCRFSFPCFILPTHMSNDRRLVGIIYLRDGFCSSVVYRDVDNNIIMCLVILYFDTVSRIYIESDLEQ